MPFMYKRLVCGLAHGLMYNLQMIPTHLAISISLGGHGQAQNKHTFYPPYHILSNHLLILHGPRPCDEKKYKIKIVGPKELGFSLENIFSVNSFFLH